MSFKKLIISSLMLVMTLILSAGAVFAWFSFSNKTQVDSIPVELKSGYGATMDFYVYKHNESILSSNSALDKQYIGDINEYIETQSINIIIAPDVPAYFLIELNGEKIEENSTLKIQFIDVQLSSYDEGGSFDPDIFDSFKLFFWDGTDENAGTEYHGEFLSDTDIFEFTDISISNITGNSSIMFFKYVLKDYTNQAATKINMEKIIFSIE